jgi:hypothetical protein
LTFRWNYLWHGFNSSGFHVTNGLLHGLCSLQLALWVHRVLRLPVPWAGLVAALFAVHPVHSESICYVVWRNEDAIDFDPGLEDVQKITKKTSR